MIDLVGWITLTNTP